MANSDCDCVKEFNHILGKSYPELEVATHFTQTEPSGTIHWITMKCNGVWYTGLSFVNIVTAQKSDGQAMIVSYPETEERVISYMISSWHDRKESSPPLLIKSPDTTVFGRLVVLELDKITIKEGELVKEAQKYDQEVSDKTNEVSRIDTGIESLEKLRRKE